MIFNYKLTVQNLIFSIVFDEKVDLSFNKLDDEKVEILSTAVLNIDELIVARDRFTTIGIKSICNEINRKPNPVRYSIL